MVWGALEGRLRRGLRGNAYAYASGAQAGGQDGKGKGNGWNRGVVDGSAGEYEVASQE